MAGESKVEQLKRSAKGFVNVVDRVTRAVRSSGDGRMRSASRELWAVLMETGFRGSSAKFLGDAKGIAKELLSESPELVRHLQSTPHLGLLQELLPVQLTRFDYVALQLNLSLRLRQRIPGLGLASELQLGRRRLSGLELLQLWAIMISSGHLFGTFATERALSYRLQSDKSALDAFLQPLPAKLANTAREKTTGAGMNEFVNVLAAWRIVQERLPRELKKTCADAMEMYLSRPEDAKGRRLIALHRRVRQAAYQRLQGACAIPSRRPEFVQVGFVSVGASPEDFFEHDDIGFDPLVDQATPMFHLMKAVDEFQFRAFFTSKEANRLVLDHLREFKVWWRSKMAEGRSIEELIVALRSRPADWPSLEPERAATGNRVLRLDLPRTKPWFPFVKDWLGDGAWDHSNVLVTEVVGTEINICDVFSPTKLSPREREHVGRMLCSGARADHASSLSVARFGLLLLKYCLKNDIRPLLEPIPAGGGHGLAMIANAFSRLASHVEQFTKACGGDRGRELQACLDALMAQRPPDEGVWLGFLGRVLLRSADAPENALQELDGLFVRVTRTGDEWFALEHKVTGQGGAGKQLARLQNQLVAKVEGKGTVQSNGNIAWIAFSSTY